MAALLRFLFVRQSKHISDDEPGGQRNVTRDWVLHCNRNASAKISASQCVAAHPDADTAPIDADLNAPLIVSEHLFVTM